MTNHAAIRICDSLSIFHPLAHSYTALRCSSIKKGKKKEQKYSENKEEKKTKKKE
jgi:hypothetical protein